MVASLKRTNASRKPRGTKKQASQGETLSLPIDVPSSPNAASPAQTFDPHWQQLEQQNQSESLVTVNVPRSQPLNAKPGDTIVTRAGSAVVVRSEMVGEEEVAHANYGGNGVDQPHVAEGVQEVIRAEKVTKTDDSTALGESTDELPLTGEHGAIYDIGDRIYFGESTNTGTITKLEGEKPGQVMVLFDHGHELSITAKSLKPSDAPKPIAVGDSVEVIDGSSLTAKFIGQAGIVTKLEPAKVLVRFGRSAKAYFCREHLKRLEHKVSLRHAHLKRLDEVEPDSAITPSETVTEAERFLQLEDEISAGLGQIESGKQRIWQAIAEIRKDDLWMIELEEGKPKYANFLDYCKQRWGWERSYSHENAVAGEVITGLLQSGIPDTDLPTSVSQVRQLAKVPESERATVLQQAREQNGGRLTAEAIKAVVSPEIPEVGSEVYYNNLPCCLTKIEGKVGVVRFPDGSFDKIGLDCLTVAPTEPIKPATLRSCEDCQHCEVEGEAWYCQKHQQKYTPTENPAVNCAQFLRFSRLTEKRGSDNLSELPVQSVRVVSPQEKKEVVPRERIANITAHGWIQTIDGHNFNPRYYEPGPIEAVAKELNPVELSERLSVLGESARSLRESPSLNLHYKRQTSTKYETELIQVAASAIAALVDLRLQQGQSEANVNLEIEREIQQERSRQDTKFGCQPQKLDPLIWIAILIEELAEASEEVWG